MKHSDFFQFFWWSVLGIALGALVFLFARFTDWWLGGPL